MSEIWCIVLRKLWQICIALREAKTSRLIPRTEMELRCQKSRTSTSQCVCNQSSFACELTGNDQAGPRRYALHIPELPVISAVNMNLSNKIRLLTTTPLPPHTSLPDQLTRGSGPRIWPLNVLVFLMQRYC